MAAALYELLERIGGLLRAEERSARPYPVQLHLLRYLSRCNDYSNTPAAAAEYLGLTKGTVSQTLLALERRGWVEKSPDPVDRRVTRLRLTERGLAQLVEDPTEGTLEAAASELSASDRKRLEATLTELLRGIQRRNGSRSFGLCRTCRWFQREPAGAHCGLTGEALREEQTVKICREHKAA